MKPLPIALLLALAAAAPAALAASGSMEVVRPWSRPAAAGTNGVGYMVVVNHGHAADALEKVESPIAARVEMHASSMAGGIMTMRRMDRIPIPAGGRVTFGPGAYHLMLVGLTRTLKAGDEAPVTLRFASGAKVAARLAVTAGLGPPGADGAAP